MRKLYILLLSIVLLGSAVFAAENIITPSNSQIITLSTNSGSTPLIVEFEPTQAAPNTKYKWEFPNGETIYSTRATQIFSLPGEYSVVLTGTNQNGNTISGSVIVTARDEANCSGDYDNDGFNDCEDLCPLVAGWTINNWCPLLEEKCDANCACADGYTCTGAKTVATCSSTGVCVPEQKKSSCYYNAEKNYLFWNAVCNSCPCKNKLEYNATIRLCDILLPAIVSPDGKQIYEKWKFFEVR